jgi:hypothetical protein
MFIFGLIRFIVKATYLYCCEMWRMDYSSQARRLEESPVTYFRSKEKHEDCETPCKICGECSCKEEFFIQNMAGRVHENCLFLFVLISSTQLKGWSRKTHEEWVFPGRGWTAPIEKADGLISRCTTIILRLLFWFINNIYNYQMADLAINVMYSGAQPLDFYVWGLGTLLGQI